MSNKVDDNVMLANCDIIVFFSIYFHFMVFRKLDSRCMVYKTSILINSNLLSYKTWKRNQKISNTALMLLLWVKVLFLPKNGDFLPKNTDISKIKRILALKSKLSKTTYVCVLTYQISSFWHNSNEF